VSSAGSESASGTPNLGVALRQAWVGYRRRLDEELARAGFGDRGFPDGRVLRICARGDDVTISSIGRELDMTRQGASKLVASLRERGYVTLRPSPEDAREKRVVLTARARSFLRAQQEAAGRLEAAITSDLGPAAVDGLRQLLDHLGGDEQPRLRDYITESRRRGGAANL
jgi:DNA-binding MarR family transcriptional regulator